MPNLLRLLRPVIPVRPAAVPVAAVPLNVFLPLCGPHGTALLITALMPTEQSPEDASKLKLKRQTDPDGPAQSVNSHSRADGDEDSNRVAFRDAYSHILTHEEKRKLRMPKRKADAWPESVLADKDVLSLDDAGRFVLCRVCHVHYAVHGGKKPKPVIMNSSFRTRAWEVHKERTNSHRIQKSLSEAAPESSAVATEESQPKEPSTGLPPANSEPPPSLAAPLQTERRGVSNEFEEHKHEEGGDCDCEKLGSREIANNLPPCPQQPDAVAGPKAIYPQHQQQPPAPLPVSLPSMDHQLLTLPPSDFRKSPPPLATSQSYRSLVSETLQYQPTAHRRNRQESASFASGCSSAANGQVCHDPACY